MFNLKRSAITLSPIVVAALVAVVALSSTPSGAAALRLAPGKLGVTALPAGGGRRRGPDGHLDQIVRLVVASGSPPPQVAGSRHNAAVPRGPALPLDVQNSYRARYRAMRPGWTSSGEQLEVLVRSHVTANSRVMDLGCGRGGVVELFWREVKLAAGLDPDVPSLAEHRAQGMPVVTGRGEHLPFAGESFDLIVCIWVLEHLRDPEGVLREVRRVLRPGGHFVFLTPNLRNPLLAFNRLGRLLPQLQRRLVSRLYGRIQADTFPVQYPADTA